MSPVQKGSLSGSSDENANASENVTDSVNGPEGTSTVPEGGTPAVSTMEGELHGATVAKDPVLEYSGPIDPNEAAPKATNIDERKDQGSENHEDDRDKGVTDAEQYPGEHSDNVETTTVDKGFVFTHNLDPSRQIPGTNKYLDVEQRREAEIDRARVEGREPDLENAPGAQGTPYRSVDALNAELPPSANVAPDVTLAVTVTQEEADRQKSQERSDDEDRTDFTQTDYGKASV